jgi:hypothetical protein
VSVNYECLPSESCELVIDRSDLLDCVYDSVDLEVVPVNNSDEVAEFVLGS